MRAARRDEARNFLRAQGAKALNTCPARETFQVRLLGRAEDLHAFLREIIIEARERQAGAVNGRLADLPMKTDALSFELELQLPLVSLVETIDRDNRNILALIAAGSDGLRCGFIGHRHTSLSR
jgi:hypothetical protein